MTLSCYDCRRPYSKGPDLVLADEVWNRIAPKPDGGGVLCPNCIHDRLVDYGYTNGTVIAGFTSGPMADPSFVKPPRLPPTARPFTIPVMTRRLAHYLIMHPIATAMSAILFPFVIGMLVMILTGESQ